jgi:SAM-dependent methyltransferase
MYDSEYFQKAVEGPAARAANTIADSIATDLKPLSAIDVGCGTGALLSALRDRGCEVLGLEYAEAALRACLARQLTVTKFDLENDSLPSGRTFDVAVSMEVAEHLPARTADRFVSLLTQLSQVVVFTAAPPGQGGTDHVNEQPPSYWIAKFRGRDFYVDDVLSARWRQDWRLSGRVEEMYCGNLMIFRRRPEAQRGITYST